MSLLVCEDFLSTPEMTGLLGEPALVQAMMDFQAALARAQARVGLVPQPAAQAIASLCRAELYDVPGLLRASGPAGSLALPLVRKLAETVALFDPAAAGYVNWGASGQDMADTAMVLQTRRALRLIDDDLLSLCGALLDLAERHAAMPLLARTQMQPALVSSLRCRLLGWVAPLLRSAQALRAHADTALLLQLGGTAGTLAALGEQADAVAAQVAIELQLRLPLMPWHTQRDRWVRLGSELGVLCGALGKMARDLALLAQAEVGEMAEADTPRAWPQGRIPVASMRALAAARRAPQRVAALLSCMDQEHERGLGSWQAELAEWASLLVSCHGSLHGLALALPNLRLYPGRMLDNIDRERDLVFAEGLARLLARVWGKARADQQVDALAALVQGQGQPLRLLARALRQSEPELAEAISAAELDAVFDSQAAAQAADTRVHNALVQARAQWAALMDKPKAP